jgi:hypothetical protein
MAAFYILVMDQYNTDPDQWLYSASSSSADTLHNTACDNQPPRGLPKSAFVAVTTARLSRSIPPCNSQDGQPEGGTIYGVRHV